MASDMILFNYSRKMVDYRREMSRKKEKCYIIWCIWQCGKYSSTVLPSYPWLHFPWFKLPVVNWRHHLLLTSNHWHCHGSVILLLTYCQAVNRSLSLCPKAYVIHFTSFKSHRHCVISDRSIVSVSSSKVFFDYKIKFIPLAPNLAFPTDSANSSVCTHLQLFTYIARALWSQGPCVFCSLLRPQHHAEPGSLSEPCPQLSLSSIGQRQTDVLGLPTTQDLSTALDSKPLFFISLGWKRTV